MEKKKIVVRLSKVYKSTEANEAKLKQYLNERHTANSKRTS